VCLALIELFNLYNEKSKKFVLALVLPKKSIMSKMENVIELT